MTIFSITIIRGSGERISSDEHRSIFSGHKWKKEGEGRSKRKIVLHNHEAKSKAERNIQAQKKTQTSRAL